MPIDLQKSLSWKNAKDDELLMLQCLQGNIIKGHGRDFTRNIFFSFARESQDGFQKLLRNLVDSHITSAFTQLNDTEKLKATGVGGGAFVHVALSAAGYEALGRQDAMPGEGQFFGRGMKDADNIDVLSDPLVDEWDAPFRETIHGIILGADVNETAVESLAQTLRNLVTSAGGTIVHVQAGKALFGKPGAAGKGEGIEHFGYVDGRSQPLLLQEDIDAETASIGTIAWNPAFPLSAALVKDAGTDDAFSFGSYFVFRKLEQDVRGFKTREQDIADELARGVDREVAGAFIVGRFEDGTPVTSEGTATGQNPSNNFNYNTDDGRRCPAHAHIRKTNPRGSGGAEPEEDERRHLMPRRGIPYEDAKREVAPADLPDAETKDEFLKNVAPKLPTSGVGLLFMAYNRDIADQFAFTQLRWSNSVSFPFTPPGPHGIDPLTGQSIPPGSLKIPRKWNDPAAGQFEAEFHGFVKMKGGEYFFSPSLTFLRSLGQSSAMTV